MKEDEEKLWISSGVMGVTTLRSLQCAVYFVVQKIMFSLRDGIEQRKLNRDPYYVYYENVPKTNSGSFRKLRIKRKVVPVYACPDIGIGDFVKVGVLLLYV